jgi:hypothetical protein
VADTTTGRVCRAAHHRSWGRENPRLAEPYWAEPHVVPSPSGTRAVFASDWGGGGTVDTYVLELPVHRRLTASLSVDHAVFSTGQRVTLSAAVHNPGIPTQADLYFLILLPDGQKVIVFGPSGAVMGTASNPSAWPALSPGLSLETAFDFDQPAFYSLVGQAGLPSGTYRFLLLLTEPGSLADGHIDSWDLWAAAVSEATYAP